MRFQFWCAVLVSLHLPHHASAEAVSEVSEPFIHEAITECISWVDGDPLDYFETEWTTGGEASKNPFLAEGSPKLETKEASFFSPQEKFVVMASEPYNGSVVTKDCTLTANPLIQMLLIDFNYSVAETILKRWGEVNAYESGFTDWPEGILLQPSNGESITFFKKRCSDLGLVTLDGRFGVSDSYAQSPSWSVSVKYFERIHAEENSYKSITDYINLACPSAS